MREKTDNQSMAKNKKAKESEWEYFDDCVICQVMKRVEKEGRNLGFSELKEAFSKQNDKNKQKNDN